MAETVGDGDGDIVVMLDAHESFRQFAGGGTWARPALLTEAGARRPRPDGPEP
ncbi:hypothetical protein [Streptomyces microflavus]|uniref:Uncharacterized protein n=1 Tax=Streptomyces microflavus TaxID=1919 RepID=A0A7H8N0J3_STRMI|nr:hypothetical protein [Streptomyces microflavus]QKW47906.1 hypothetical protein HUT09_35920 [Streptomyces microflavus]